ncbi:MAG: hypothetical protein KC457_27910, partial [Myxococcales bacterium]|nr:hypothetical protein [Myxococcales bacterium]
VLLVVGARPLGCSGGLPPARFVFGDGLLGEDEERRRHALDFSKGMPPTLSVCNDSSLGEQIQAAFPATKVIKTLNTVNCNIMVDPSLVAGAHTMFIAGDDGDAKAEVERTVLREWFGWRDVVDLGGISAARGTEMYLPMWVRMWGALGTANFNIHVNRG